MGNQENAHPLEEGEQANREVLDPHHFYAAYVFDQAQTRSSDLHKLIEKSIQLGYPARYWWLSEAMDLQDAPDRLIVCVHHPSHSEEAGMDLYDVLRAENVTWDTLEAASFGEYQGYGKPVDNVAHLQNPDRRYLFPDAHFGVLAGELIQRVEQTYGISLQYDSDSIVWLDGWLETTRTELPAALFGQLSDLCGAFVGEHLRQAYGGNWQYQEEERKWGVELEDVIFAFPMSKVYKHLLNGTKDSVLAYVKIIEGILSGDIDHPDPYLLK